MKTKKYKKQRKCPMTFEGAPDLLDYLRRRAEMEDSSISKLVRQALYEKYPEARQNIA